jgi:hypothetical protein
MPDPYETLVRWYLRFNGFLGVESFVVHEPAAPAQGEESCRPATEVIPQGAEFDILAVRLPYSREEAGFEIQRDGRLEDRDAREKALVECVIAEVKSGTKLSLNRIWRLPDPDGRYRNRIEYLVRWLGPFKDEATIEAAAVDLQQDHRTVRDGYLIRLVYFASRTTDQAVPAYVPQITFRNIAEFIVDVRGPCWEDHGVGARSAHPQWDPMIKEIWGIGNPKVPGTREEKIERILACVPQTK